MKIFLKPITGYISDFTQKYNFYELIKCAATHNEIALGYRKSKDREKLEMNYGVVINPYKNDFIDFTESDLLIVLSMSD